ncbi:MAG: hypothetical protein SWH61_16115 [Thermodesulfobacteriota bacterium]|nr:hypothetical protein [Thermodesulfobacteriota bacterium]
MKVWLMGKNCSVVRHAVVICLAMCCCIGFTAGSWAAIEDYTGSYSGTYSGDDNGVFHVIAGENGAVVGMGWSTDTSEAVEIEGSVDDDGNFDLQDSWGGEMTGSIDTDGHLTGTWTGGTMSGDLEGQVQDPDQLEAIAGNYAGSSTGDSNGSWEMTVNANGYLGGFIDSDTYDTIEPIGGVVNADGVIIALGDDETMCYGTVNIDTGRVSGEWYNYDAPESGTFSGSRVVDDNNDGSNAAIAAPGDGGGGGCFIQNLY